MRKLTKVYGSKENKIPLSINGNTVYVRSNFQKVDTNELNEACDLYKYDEIQYTKDEFITILSQENSTLKQQLLDTQLALCEIFESISH